MRAPPAGAGLPCSPPTKNRRRSRSVYAAAALDHGESPACGRLGPHYLGAGALHQQPPETRGKNGQSGIAESLPETGKDHAENPAELKRQHETFEAGFYRSPAAGHGGAGARKSCRLKKSRAAARLFHFTVLAIPTITRYEIRQNAGMPMKTIVEVSQDASFFHNMARSPSASAVKTSKLKHPAIFSSHFIGRPPVPPAGNV